MYWFLFLIIIPAGESGRQPWPAKVLLVATHADRVPEGEEVNVSGAVTLAKEQFWADFDLVEHVYVVDAHLAMAPELKLLRNKLGECKQRIVKVRKSLCWYNDGTLDPRS